MLEARLFDGTTTRIVSALDVKNGLIDRNEQFIDIEYEFRVTYVSASKGHGNPYFRLYMAKEDYKRLSDEQKERYDILRTMRHYKESPWHREWKQTLSEFCKIEKSVRNNETLKYKIADAYYVEKETVIELQHSFIAHDFEERNEHYGQIGLNVVWLYDLPRAKLKKAGENEFEILEDNARGFFRIAEHPENLVNYPVFIQTHDGNVYLVKELRRKEIDNELKSTIRLFSPVKIFTPQEFVQALRNLEDDFLSHEYAEKKGLLAKSIYDLWKPGYYKMIVRDTKSDDIIAIFRDKKNPEKMSRNFGFDNIGYVYMGEGPNGGFYQKSEKFYDLAEWKAKEKRWIYCGHYKIKK